MITLLKKDVNEIEVSKRMALRFMGCRDDNISEAMQKIYEDCLGRYYAVAELKAVYRKSSVTFKGDNVIGFDFGDIESESLCKNLAGCKNAYVFAATAGQGVDRSIKRFSLSSEAESMIFSCIASSGVEGWCDYVNCELSKNHKLRPRFSPGYGDVPLSVQPDILSFLDATRKIGISLTQSLMMVPVKSVTAIIGIEE